MDRSISKSCFDKILEFVHELTGITIAQNRIFMLEGRLRRRLIALDLNSYEAYLHRVKNDAEEQAAFIDCITTNETYFFRTPRIWTFLQDTFLPNWYENNPGKTCMVWSAAAATGAEAHSLGVLCQAFKEEHPRFEYKILGTDVSQEMIQICKVGRYSGRTIRSFQNARPNWFAKHMRQTANGEYAASEEIQKRICFREHNLFDALEPRVHFDLVLLRNVLIYFKPDDQAKVLSLVYPRLKQDGILIIGESESLMHVDCQFHKVTSYVYEKILSNPLAASC